MKATNKIIIGIVALVALLITIAGALATPSGSFDPNSNPVTVQKNVSQDFKYTITNNDLGNLTYSWYVDNGNNPVQKETNMSATYTSLFNFKGSDYAVGPHTVTVTVFGSPDYSVLRTWTVNVQDVQPEELVTISSIKVNGKTSGKLKQGEINDIEIEVSNDYSKKMDSGVDVNIDLVDKDDSSIADDSDVTDSISSGSSKSVTLKLDLRKENLDQDNYNLKVEISGSASDNTKHSNTKKQTVTVDRKKDDVIIIKADLQDGSVVCSAAAQDSLKVRVRNIGKNNQNNAKIIVKNAELNLNQKKENIDLDDYSGSDNEYDATFGLNLQDAKKQGTYTLDVSVYSENDELMDSQAVDLQIQCADTVATPTSESTGTTEHYADQELAAQLQKQLEQYKVSQEAAQSTSNQSFRQSNSYVALLGVLVAMMFFAAVLTATYLLVKKSK